MREFVLISVFIVLSIFSCQAQTDYSDYDYLGKSVEDILSEAKSAADSDGFIREDRVWHLRQNYNDIMSDIFFPEYGHGCIDYTYFTDFAFSGTIDFYGKTYNNCYAWYVNDDLPNKEAAPIGFMREEDSKIYSYCPPGWEEYILKKYCLDVMRTGSHVGYWDGIYTKDCEVLIYDFSLQENDLMFYNEEFYSQYQLSNINPKWTSLQGLVVNNVSNIEIKDKIYKKQDYNMYSFKTQDNSIKDYTYFYTVLDSIGPLFGYPCYPSYYSASMCKSRIDLVNITDLDGNVLFDASWIPDNKEGVDEICAGNVVRTVYHDLFGRETENLAGGVYIRTRIYDSSRQVSDKVVIK